MCHSRLTHVFIAWGDQLCSDAEHTSDTDNRSWLMFFALQEYFSAFAVSNSALPTTCLNSSGILQLDSSIFFNDDPEIAALVRWSYALRDVAAESGSVGRGVLENIAHEKMALANALNQVDISSSQFDFDDEHLFGGFPVPNAGDKSPLE